MNSFAFNGHAQRVLFGAGYLSRVFDELVAMGGH